MQCKATSMMPLLQSSSTAPDSAARTEASLRFACSITFSCGCKYTSTTWILARYSSVHLSASASQLMLTETLIFRNQKHHTTSIHCHITTYLRKPPHSSITSSSSSSICSSSSTSSGRQAHASLLCLAVLHRYRVQALSQRYVVLCNAAHAVRPVVPVVEHRAKHNRTRLPIRTLKTLQGSGLIL
jgi:hypothetical protein